MTDDIWRQKIPLEMRTRVERRLETIISNSINPKPAEVLHQLMMTDPNCYDALVNAYGNPNSDAMHEMVRRRIDKSAKPKIEPLSAIYMRTSEGGRVEIKATIQNGVEDFQVRPDSGTLQPVNQTYRIEKIATVVVENNLVEVNAGKIMTDSGTLEGRYIGHLDHDNRSKVA